MLRILYAAWKRREKRRSNWRGFVWATDLRDSMPFTLFRRPWKTGQAEIVARALGRQGLARQCGYFNAYQITPAGRRAVERANG